MLADSIIFINSDKTFIDSLKRCELGMARHALIRLRGYEMNHRPTSKGRNGKILSLLLVAACGSTDEPAGQTEGSPEEQTQFLSPEDVEVARVQLGENSYVGWYEVHPGVILRGQKFRYPEKAVELDPKLSPSEQYRKLAPNSQPPPALLAAEARQAKNDLRPGPSMEMVTEQEDLTEPPTETSVQRHEKAVDDLCPWEWFQSTHCVVPGADWSVSWGYSAGTSWFLRNDNLVAKTGACAFIGTIHYRLKFRYWFDWSTPVSVNLAPGEGWVWDHTNFNKDWDIESRVDQADGDGYHHCGQGRK